jgi:hypothetical protein
MKARTNVNGTLEKLYNGGFTMDGNSLLSGGVETLQEIKECLLELQGFQTQYDSLTAQEEKVKKEIQSVEKALSEEITSTLKKRRQEIEDTFDKQIHKSQAKVKKAKDKRDKHKNSKISERIQAETTYLREDNNRLTLEIKTLLKQKRLPSFCNTRVFYALYLPKYFGDFLIILLTLLLALFVIPCGIYFFVLPEEKTLYLILSYVFSILVIGIIYVLIGNFTKEKNPEVMNQIKGLRSEMMKNKKKMSAIKKSIMKDSDESSYGLENFDTEIAKLEKKSDEIVEQKKSALLTFDNTTNLIITSEIKSRYEEKLNRLQSEHDDICAKSSQMEDKVKALTLKIASEYEPILGKDLMTLDRLDALTNILKAGNAQTVSEAIAFYRQNMNTEVMKL